QAAIESARAGFAEWSAMSAIERSRILLKAVGLLRDRDDELAAVEVRDTGKPWQEAEAVDVVTGADAIEFFAGLAPSIEGNQQDLGGDFHYTRREPLGICAGIGAWNYPLQIACWKSAPALACGNAMIFKPSEETPMGALSVQKPALSGQICNITSCRRPCAMTARRIGRINYVALNLVVMVGLTMLFQLDFLRIQWVGALVIALYFACFAYILANKRAEVAAIKSSPEENILDFRKIEMAG